MRRGGVGGGVLRGIMGKVYAGVAVWDAAFGGAVGRKG